MFHFLSHSKKLNNQASVVLRRGFFHRQITQLEGVALILSATIGAGVLGIPYAISKTGLAVGLVYIIGLGILMIGLNLLIGEIAVRTDSNLQLVGLAKKYLGRAGGYLMVIIKYVSGLGILVVYIIGTGQSLAVLFGGSALKWSLIFFTIASIMIYNGLKTIKVVDFFLSLAILLVVLLIAGFAGPHIEMPHLKYIDLAGIFLPYGVILFAYDGGEAVLEAHSILIDRQKTFKSTIIIAGIIAILTYSIFAVVVLGVTGQDTTEIATIGLGHKLGPIMLLFGNVFAILAMSTSFLTIGQSLRDSLIWDYKVKEKLAVILVCFFPLVIFLLGLRSFIATINIIGGVFISLTMLLTVLIYWSAKNSGDIKPNKYRLGHSWLIMAFLLLALILGAIYSIINLF
ncbi:MAG: hypothetical protein COU31_04605 [Candidatus Magasanikbacteria bacterium CG10_big_fil_rev_8_21_14_0_10_40_10]|uniref:Amino acid transporter transmembrane domain-containing protein n=1 Tax=Candidatus Magasanikbacteria bacterium CG10_big_fil_rev_8_21_14_0_10_40_10 TaxID=1974648 RepID=A0A2M6W2V6_9BACT|nr:MAG: hypothetical protein COU31_04605 [Candidatus Magasanikbacteria bacterium CG10_big_fil_rev_8_21_14_0_10_40_10]